MKISNQLMWTLVVIFTVYGYFQGVVVPQTEIKYTQQAVVASMGRTLSSGTVKSFPCNPTQVKCGKLVIKKDSVPDSYQDFTFVHQTIPGYPQTFTLDDDAGLSNASTLSNTAAFYTPYNGTFLVAEVVNASYNVTITCSDPSGGTNVSGAIATISIYNGESVTCTFKNVPVTTTTACTPNTWTQKADFGGGPRIGAVGFSIGGKGYIGTGGDVGFSLPTNQDFWEYNPATNVWTQKADFGGGLRWFAVGFSIGNKGYVGTGVDGSYNEKKDFWEYNPTTNIWTQKANFGGVERRRAIGFSIGTKGYVGIGYNSLLSNNLFSDFWEYNPTTNIWTQKANFGGGARHEATGFSIGTKGYVGTGTNNNAVNYQDLWEYNPLTNVWTQKANFGGGPRRLATGFSIGTKGYIGTGGGSGVPQDFWEYTPLTNIWTQKANFGGGFRNSGVGFSIGTKGYIGTGGGLSGSMNDFWEYCP